MNRISTPKIKEMVKNNKLIIYEIAYRWKLIFYLIATLMILIPISWVLITGNAFSPFYSNLIINTSIIFIIVGRVLAVYKKAIDEWSIPWAGLGSITGLLIVLIWRIFK